MAMPTSLLISLPLCTRDLIRLSGLTPMRAPSSTPGEIAPECQTTVVRSDDVAATVVLKGPHEHGAPAGSSQKEVQA